MTPEDVKRLILEAIKALPSGTATYMSICERMGVTKGEGLDNITDALADLEKDGVIVSVSAGLYHWRIA